MLMRRAENRWLKHGAIAAVSLLLGFLLVTQIRTITPTYEQQVHGATDSEIASYLSELYIEVADLRREYAGLQHDLTAYQQDDPAALVQKAIAEDEELRAINGEGGLVGTGVSVQIRGEVSMFDLQDLINELRNAGAEGISLNGTRILARTLVSSLGGQVITLDGKPIRSPYILRAVGSAPDLKTALERRGGLLEILQEKELSIEVAVSDSITLPKAAAPYALNYAQPAPTVTAEP